MRFVVFGAGAIGGVVGARLHQADEEVLLIARGAHYEAIASGGLRLETPEENVVLEIPVVEDPLAISWREDDVVLLATKTQDTAGALGARAEVAPPSAVHTLVSDTGFPAVGRATLEQLGLKLFLARSLTPEFKLPIWAPAYSHCE